MGDKSDSIIQDRTRMNSNPGIPKEKESLQEFKDRMRSVKRANSGTAKSDVVDDEYDNIVSKSKLIRKKTGIIYSNQMELHECIWDKYYPECPARYTAIMKRLEDLNLLDRCSIILLEEVKMEQIFEVHHKELVNVLNDICQDSSYANIEKKASEYDAIYFNKNTFDCAKLAVSCTLSLVNAIRSGIVQNGLAVIRPPGHHAQRNEFNGYCYFNNVAIAAKQLLKENDCNKIMIVDFDVHHGQGIQKTFYDNNRVLYFSIHRYEYGSFWPNLRESDYDHIGEKNGKGFNINVPLNTTGLGDTDYMAIVTNLLLPVAYEFNPDIILFAAGYDSAVGDEKGNMLVSPGFYGHLIKLLSGLAEGRLAVMLEGGYFLPSLAEGVAMTLRGLLDDNPPFLETFHTAPHDSVIDTINNVQFALHDYWECFKILYAILPTTNIEIASVQYMGIQEKPPYATRNCYPIANRESILKFTELVKNYEKSYGKPKYNKVCYNYDESMLLHINTSQDTVENPDRLKAVYTRFCELNLNNRCSFVPISMEINKDTINAVHHHEEYLRAIYDDSFVATSTDLYWCRTKSRISVLTAVRSLLTVVDSVARGHFTSGVALIRPPGHHAEPDNASGFCFINNVAVAAQYLIDKQKYSRILILDMDIHHGNGTQKSFYESDQVLYISIHKFEHAKYFPKKLNADIQFTGSGRGEGFNVNIAFNDDKMGDTEYLAAFHRIILPLAYAFAPEIILVSAGFDAGINDVLGNYQVSPETFGHFIQLLRPLAQGRIILAMEGGYNPTTLKHAMCVCVKALLGDPLPKIRKLAPLKLSAHRVFEKVIRTLKDKWPILSMSRPLNSEEVTTCSNTGIIEENLHNIKL